MFAASEKAVEEFVANIKVKFIENNFTHEKEQHKNNHQKITDPDQSGASACLLSFDYNLQGISDNKNISQTC